MTALSITATNVKALGGSETFDGVAGAAITAGQVVYRDSSDGTLKLADCDAATAPPRSPAGIALNGAATGQPVKVLSSGPITIGATMSAGVAYYLGATPGDIVPVGDLEAGDFPTIVGIAQSTTVLSVKFHESGFELA